MADDAAVNGDVAGGHFAEGPLPHIIFLQAARLVAAETDGVMAHLMQEDGGGDRRARLWHGNQAFDPAIAVFEFIRHAAHVLAPLADGDVIPVLEFIDHRIVGAVAQADALVQARRGHGNRMHAVRVQRHAEVLGIAQATGVG